MQRRERHALTAHPFAAARQSLFLTLYRTTTDKKAAKVLHKNETFADCPTMPLVVGYKVAQ